MADKPWDSKKHPRGQPDNSGQFASAPSYQAEAADVGTVLLDARPSSVGRAVLEGDVVWFEYPYNPDINKLLKKAGARFDGNRKQWWVPVNQQGLADLFEKVNFAKSDNLADKELSSLGGHAGTATIEGDRIWLDYPFSRETNETVKTCGARFDKDQKRWWVSASNPFADDLFSKHNFRKPDGWDDALAEEKPNNEVNLEGFDIEPMPFQMEGIQHALDNRKVIIGDQPGLGKTVQALAAVHSDDAFPAVVVCPANLVSNWEREAKRAMGAKSIFKVDSAIEGPLTADVTIMSYNRLESALEHIPSDAKALIFDESHYLKSWQSKRTKAALKLSKSMPEGSMTMLLSGTPLPNKVAELAPQLEVLGKLDDFGGWKRYADRYCAPQQIYTRNRVVTTYNGAANLGELSDKLKTGTLIRRMKKDVLEDLPPKMYSVVTVDAAERLEEAYQESEDTLFTTNEEQEDEMLNNGQAVSEIVGLMAKCPDLDDIPPVLVQQAQEAIAASTELATLSGLRQLTGVMKLGPAVEYVNSMLDGGDGKVVVFAHHRPIIERLASELEAGAVFGGTSPEERDRLIADFQSDDPSSSRVIVLGATASAEGINLQRGSDVVMVEQPWNPGLCEQAEDRCHRFGQDSQVTIHYLLAADTIDEKVASLVESKRKVIGKVLDDTDSPSGDLPDDAGNEDMASLILDWLREERRH